MSDSARRVALITGAAGSIGRAMAERLHRDGLRIVAVDLDADRLDALRTSIPGVTLVAADVSNPADCDRAVAAADGRIDVLINNAAVADGGGCVDELDEATWSRVIEVNLSAAFLLSRRVIGPMLAAKAGVIVNMSSVAGLRGGRTGIAYTASKWALVGMAQNIAATLGEEGIRAYAVCPSLVAGAASLGSKPPMPRSLRRKGRDRDEPAAITAEAVAESVSFLISDSARHLNGIALPIDRGWLAY